MPTGWRVYIKNQFSIDNRQLITYLKDSLTSEQAPSFCSDFMMGEIRQSIYNGGGDIIGVLCMIFRAEREKMTENYSVRWSSTPRCG